MTEEEQVYPTEAINIITKWQQLCNTSANKRTNQADRLQSSADAYNRLKGMIFRIDGSTNVALDALFGLTADMMLVINNIVSVIDKLPNIDEFNAVKKELERNRKVINGVVIPVKKLYDEAAERDRRGEEIDGYS